VKIFRGDDMKKIFAIATLALCLLASPAFAENDIVATYFVVNCRESITLRDTPSVYGGELAQIPLGQAVGFIDDIGNGFYKINYDGLVGFALAEYLSPNRADVSRSATVANCKQSITLRETPSVYSRELTQIPLGARVKILSEGNEFYEVEYRGLTGFVLKTYIELD